MPTIHLLNTDGPEYPQPCESSPGIVETGHWRVSPERADAMIGHPIHLHRRKAEAAFQSGIVTSYRREPYITPKGNTSPRIVFVFSPTPDTNTITDTKGWTLAGVKFVP